MSEPGDAVIDALAREGEHVADGQFTIDAERAGALAAKQVAEPQRWPVFLVEVAYLLGAAGIDFHFGGWVVSAELELPGVEPEILDLLERFGEGRGPDDPAKQLGVVFRSARVAGADTITIEAIRADGTGKRCTWKADDYARYESCAAKPGLRVWVRFAADADEPGAAELAELNRRCRPSRFPVSIDGNPVSVGWTGAFGQFGATEVLHSTPVVLDGVEIGLAGVYERARAGRLALMQHGVVVEFLPLPEELERGVDGAFTAVVEVGLPRDLSQTRFVRWPEFRQIMAAIAESHERVVDEIDDSTRALVKALAPPVLSSVDPLEHAEDLAIYEKTARSRTTLAGGASIGLGLVLWAVSAGTALPTIVPLALIGAGVLLVLRELG